MIISPAEYLYIKKPIHSGPTKILVLVIQELCLKEVITIKEKWIQIHPKEKRTRKRLFFKKAKNFDNYKAENKAEQFILEIFETLPTFRLFQFRNYLNHKFGKNQHERFKNEIIYGIVKQKKLLWFNLFMTSKAKEIVRPIDNNLIFLNQNIDSLIHNNVDELINSIDNLKSHILNLETSTLDKIKNIPDSIFLTAKLNLTGINSLGGLSSLNAGLSVLNLDFSESFSSDFGGFSDGDFGGGGAGGDW